MADNIVTIILRVRDETRTAFNDVTASLNELQKSVDTLSGQTIGKMGNSIKEVQGNTAGMRKELESLSTSLEGIRTRGRQVFTVFAGIFLGGVVKGIADAAARTQVLGTVLGIVGANAGISRTQLLEMDKAIQKQGITAAASRQSLTQLIQAGLISAQTSYKAAQLARAAQDLAVVSGQNSSETFSRLVVNINQMDSMGLRFMGIMLNREEAYRRYAQSVNKTAESLSLAEKKQAFFNGVLEESNKLAGTYEASMADVGKQVQSLARYKENLSVSIGNNLLPAYLALVESFTEVLKVLGLGADEFGKQSEAAQVLGNAVKGVGQAFVDLTKIIVQFKEVVGGLALLWAVLKTPTAFSKIAEVFGLAVLKGKDLLVIFGRFSILLRSLPLLLNVVAASIASAFSGYAIGKALLEMSDTVREWSKAIVFYFLGEFDRLLLFWDELALRAEYAFKRIKNWATLGGQAGSDSLQRELDRKLAELDQRRVQITQLQDEAFAGLGGKEREDAFAKATELIDKADKVKDKLLELEAERTRLSEAAANQGSEMLKSDADRVGREIEKLKVEQKNLLEAINLAKAEAPDVATREKIQVYQADIRLNKTKAEAALKKAKDDLDEARKAVGLDKFEISGNLIVSQDFERQVAGFRDLLKGYTDPVTAEVRGKVEKAAVSLREVAFAYDQIGKSANEYNEIVKLLNVSLGTLADNSERVVARRETLTYERDKKLVAELTNLYGGLINRLKELQEAEATIRSVFTDQVSSFDAFKQVILELGGSVLGDAASGVYKLSNAFGLYKDNVASLSRLTADRSTRELGLSRETADQQIADAKRVYDRQVALINQEITDTTQRKNAIIALQKELANNLIGIETKVYEAAKKGRDGALESFKQYASEIKRLTQEIRSIQEEGEKALYELRQKGLSDAEKLAQDRIRAEELDTKAKLAYDSGDFEEAKRQLKEVIALRKSIAERSADQQTGLIPQTEINEVEDAYRRLEDVTKAQRAEAEKAAAAQLAAYKELAAQVDRLGGSITKLSEGVVSQIKIELDQPSLNAARDSIESAAKQPVTTPVLFSADQGSLSSLREAVTAALQGIEVSVIARAVGGAVARAGGGRIEGPGTETSDSILARLSRGEWVIKAAAVRHYGDSFMDAVNSMALPKFADGGPVQPIASAPSSSEPVQAIDINLNRRKVARVSGARQDIKNLVSVLQTLERGV